MNNTVTFLEECLGNLNLTLEDSVNRIEIETGFKRQANQSLEDFINERSLHVLKKLWRDTFFSSSNKYSKTKYHYLKMSISKYIAVKLDKIGKDKTFYFLGKRFTKVGEVNKIAKHFNWTWEKEDPSKADFFILGDNPTLEEAKLNENLSKPVVMDEEMRIQLHFLFDEEVVIEEVNQDMVAEYLDQCNLDHLKMICCIIKFLKEGVLSDENRYRLIRCFVSTYTKLNRPFSLSDKDDVLMSETVLRYCFPQHRYLVTNHFLTLAKRHSGWIVESSQNSKRLGRARVFYYFGLGSGSRGELSSYIHDSPGASDIFLADMDKENRYSIITKYKFEDTKPYCSLSKSAIVRDVMSKIILDSTSTDHPRFAIYTKRNEDKLELLAFKFNNSTDDSNLSTVVDKISREKLKELNPQFESIAQRILDISKITNYDPKPGIEVISETSLLTYDKSELYKIYMDFETLILENKDYEGSENSELLDRENFKARRKAVKG